MALTRLLLRRFNCSKRPSILLLAQIPNSLHFSSFSAAPDSVPQTPSAAKPTSLSARLNFIFEHIDETSKSIEEKDQALQRIRACRESQNQKDPPIAEAAPDPPVVDSTADLKSELAKSEAFLGSIDAKKEVEFVHPWPEWIELMERLVQQNYFDHKRKDEDGMMRGIGFDMSASSAVEEEDQLPDFARDFKTVQAALVNFGRDRFDILRALSRQDLQVLVGYGCPSTDKRLVYSAKLLRKLVHLDEGDVCSSCSLRGSCEKAYLLSNKEDEARTMDVMRMLLAYGFDPIDGSVTNRSLLKNKSVKTVVRKLLHQVVKLSAVPIDPNLTPPVIKKPPLKVKQPPPPPKRRVGRDDIEMKKGDWLCPKCEFMNFAKNTVCLQCDAKRPKRQLLPGEWECPQCNFLNYRRNTDCFHCEHKRPPETYPENHFPEKQHGSHMRMEKKTPRADVSNAWNFDFDDNESDGADVAAFEFADSRKLDEDFPPREISRGYGFDPERSRPSRGMEMEYSDTTSMKPSTGFNDFDEDDDDDDVDSYEVVAPNEVPKTPRVHLSELEEDSESEDLESNEGNWQNRGKAKFPERGRKQMNHKKFSDPEVGFDTDDDLPIHPDWKSSHVADAKQQRGGRNTMNYGSDVDSGSDDEQIRSQNRGNRRGSDRKEFTTTRGGRRSKFSESFSEGDSDDDLSYKSDRPRDKRGLDHTGSRGNRRGSNRMEYSNTRGGRRSSFNESFSDRDSDDDQSYKRDRQIDRRGLDRPGNRGNRQGSNIMGYSNTRGGRSSFNSETDSDDDQSYKRDRQTDKRGLDRAGNRRGSNRMEYSNTRGGRSNFNSERDYGDDLSYGNDRQRDKRGPSRPSRGRGGMMGDRRGGDFGRSSGAKSFDRGSREDSYGGRGKSSRDGNSSKFRGGSGKRGGRRDSFDDMSKSYEDDGAKLRPRVNVR